MTAPHFVDSGKRAVIDRAYNTNIRESAPCMSLSRRRSQQECDPSGK
jgi:hypothetical protein